MLHYRITPKITLFSKDEEDDVELQRDPFVGISNGKKYQLEKYLPDSSYEDMLLGLLPGQENMSTSDSSSAISMDDEEAMIEEAEVERKKENGGAKVFAKYEQLVADYAKGDLHPAYLKHALTKVLKKILQYVHDHFKNDEKTKALLKKVKVQDPITLTACIILERRQQIQQNTFADQRRTRMNAEPFKETQQSSEHINISSQCRTRINAHHPNRPLHSFDHRKRIFCAA
ncbi:hypothetical protein Tco_1036157 [Tanacetum coccineum]